ncbi:MAG: hypothetical protein QOK11_2148, partial [Pseudonocardiales bacterium]|nr:hypothetical protein [Pseudonocardiales bacterium]
PDRRPAGRTCRRAAVAALDRSPRAIIELAQLRSTEISSPFPQLSKRELDILELVARGLDNQAIARQLVLTSKTVRNHVSNVLAKLNAGDRSQAIVLARRRGFGEPD